MVSCVIVNWKRPGNLPTIIARLRECAWCEQVIVWDNSGVLGNIDGATVVPSWSNQVTWGRFLATQLAHNEIIYTQDDDCLPGKEWLDLAHERFMAHQRYIVHGLDRGHYNNEAEGKRPWALLGWGAFFLREWLSDFCPWLIARGEDELLMRKADRIFGVLRGGKHDAMIANFRQLPGATGEESLYRQSKHGLLTKQAVMAARELLTSRK